MQPRGLQVAPITVCQHWLTSHVLHVTRLQVWQVAWPQVWQVTQVAHAVLRHVRCWVKHAAFPQVQQVTTVLKQSSRRVRGTHGPP
jgi:hypothetical protein